MSGWDSSETENQAETHPKNYSESKADDGWNLSEDENRFELSPNDFTPVRIQEDGNLSQPHHTSAFVETQQNPIDENFFYEKLGFKVGNYFDGSKKIYSKRAK